MNRIVFIIISLLMTLSLLVACSDNSDETTGENENSNDNQNEEVATEPKEPEEPEENNDSNATNDESSSGYKIEEGEDLDLPDGFPSDIPMPDPEDSSITFIISDAEHMLGYAYQIHLDYTGDKSYEEILDMYKEYMDSNFEGYETFEEGERSGEYSGFVGNREYFFTLFESALEENLITLYITIGAEE